LFDWDEIKRDSEGRVLLLYRHQRVLDEGIVTPGMKVLDVGGWGVLATRFNEEGIECIIIDNFSEDQYYPERVRSLLYIHGDITQSSELVSWGQGTYDVVTCFEMLEHCKQQAVGVRNMYKMLKPGGTIVGTFPIPGRVHAVDDSDVNFLTEEELRELLEAARFEDILVEPTGSVVKEEEPCSLYFRARKSQGMV